MIEFVFPVSFLKFELSLVTHTPRLLSETGALQEVGLREREGTRVGDQCQDERRTRFQRGRAVRNECATVRLPLREGGPWFERIWLRGFLVAG